MNGTDVQSSPEFLELWKKAKRKLNANFPNLSEAEREREASSWARHMVARHAFGN